MRSSENDLLLYISYLEAIIDNLPCGVWAKRSDGSYITANKFMKDNHEYSKTADSWSCSRFFCHKPESLNDNGGLFDLAEAVLERTERGVYISASSTLPDSVKAGGISIGFTDNVTQEILLSNFPGVAYRSKDDAEFTMTFISEGCLELTGYSVEELLQKRPSYYDLIHPDYKEGLLDKWQNDTRTSDFSSDEYPIKTASGEEKWVWELFNERRSEDQTFIATEGFISDITKRKKAEEALIASESRFRTVFENAPLGMGIFDSDSGNALQVNKKYAEVLGRREEDLVGTNPDDYSYYEDLNTISEIFIEEASDSSASINKRLIKGDGSVIWVKMIISPFPSSNYNKPCHLCMIEDITREKEIEEKILFLGYHDMLTGLFNRRYYEEALNMIDTPENLPISLIVADVNGLKLTNDAFGHKAGDQLLITIARILKGYVGNGSIAARIGGDEFAMLLPKTCEAEAEKIMESIIKSISAEKVKNISCSASFGLSSKKLESDRMDSVFAKAESHMYKQKLYESASMKSKIITSITSSLKEVSNNEQLHNERVSDFCVLLGKALGLSSADLNDLKTAAMLHDIGKIGLDRQLLEKTVSLTEEERLEMRRHPEIGYQLLNSIGEFSHIAKIVLHHHEHIDGSGYPDHLKGDEIPAFSKIIHVATAYDTMTNRSLGGPPLTEEMAIKELRENAGTQFDREIVELFINCCINK
ncbi:hypothetical protein MASR2M70_11130 [Bacillota bacterium]